MKIDEIEKAAQGKQANKEASNQAFKQRGKTQVMIKRNKLIEKRQKVKLAQRVKK